MTRDDTERFLRTLMAPWPNMPVSPQAVDTYYATLAHLSFGDAMAALHACLSEAKYPPTPADIVQTVAEGNRDKLKIVGPYRTSGGASAPRHRRHPTIAIDPDTEMEVYAVELPDGKGGTKPRHFLRATAEQRRDHAERTKRMAEEGKRLKAERDAKHRSRSPLRITVNPKLLGAP